MKKICRAIGTAIAKGLFAENAVALGDYWPESLRQSFGLHGEPVIGIGLVAHYQKERRCERRE